MIEFKNVTYEVTGPRNNKIKIIDDVSFKVDNGVIFGIAGQSGGGKTSIAKLLAGVNRDYSGSIKVNEKSLIEYLKTRKLQILFQNNNELINPLRSIYDVLEEVLNIGRCSNPGKKIQELIRLMKLPKEVINKKGYELSGGQQQRVALARILAAEPDIIIMDEPFSAQDADSQFIIAQLMTELNKEFNITFLIISHDLYLLKNLTHQIIIVKNGRIIESGDTSKVLENPEHPHTQFLLHSISYELTKDELRKGV